MRLTARITSALLVITALITSATYFIREPANPGFEAHAAVVGVHAIAGAVYLVLAPLQFGSGVRLRFRAYHRATGWLLVAVASMVGLTALFTGIAIPYAGAPEAVLISIFGTYFLVCVTLGAVSIRARRLAQHREWMIRGFALALAVATQRLLFVPATFLIDDLTHDEVAALAVTAWAAAMILHVLAAEAWLRSTRRLAPRAGRQPAGPA